MPITVVVSEGAVVILGPDGLAAALTPDAAEESGRRLIAAAVEARCAIFDQIPEED